MEAAVSAAARTVFDIKSFQSILIVFSRELPRDTSLLSCAITFSGNFINRTNKASFSLMRPSTGGLELHAALVAPDVYVQTRRESIPLALANLRQPQ